MSSGKTTRRTFICRTGMITSGLTLGLKNISPVNSRAGNILETDMKAGGRSIGDQLTGPEVSHDYYIIYPEPKKLNKSVGKISLA